MALRETPSETASHCPGCPRGRARGRQDHGQPLRAAQAEGTEGRNPRLRTLEGAAAVAGGRRRRSQRRVAAFPRDSPAGRQLGLRCGEIYGLKWSDLAEDARTIAVSRSNNRGEIADTKTEAGERIVPLFGTVRAALLEWRLASRHSQDDDLIFPDEFGREEYATHVNDRDLQATFKKAGLPSRAWRFHSLKHYAVSKLIEQGAAITLIAKVAGHADPSVTLSTYSHLMPTGAADAADKYDPVARVANDR